ncbi:MAG: hypothetical protein IT330_05830 [Anaerolineae bacterium]|nr:hypothetical protein [Anaerolineae bacterium]
MEHQAAETRELWGKILFSSGLFLLVMGVFLWVFVGALLIVQPEQGLSFGEGVIIGGLCCFGPCGILGGFLAIIGRVLWSSSRSQGTSI